MRWIVGIDTRNRSQGALRFAGWLREQMRDADYESRGFHVLEHDEMMVLLRRSHLTEVLTDAESSLRKAVESAQAGDILTSAEVVQAATAERFLAEATKVRNADGLIIGRSAAREGRAIVRLGRVARRLVRMLPAPVIVTPPDLEVEHLGDGPVLCAVSPTLECVDAARTAIGLAKKLGREAILVHGVKLPDAVSLSGSFHDELLREQRESAQESLAVFCEAHGLADARREVVLGAPEDTVPRRTEELRAPLVVCGSRRLDVVQRMFRSSVGTDLASHSKVPVMIVPPR